MAKKRRKVYKVWKPTLSRAEISPLVVVIAFSVHWTLSSKFENKLHFGQYLKTPVMFQYFGRGDFLISSKNLVFFVFLFGKHFYLN